MIDFDEIRKEVAIKHGVLLDKDDPVLATVTINETLLQRYVEILNAQNEAHQKALTLALGQGIEESKKVAGRIVTEGANYVSDQCKTAIEASLKEVEERINKQVVFIVKAREDALTARQMAVFGAGMSAVFMFMTWGAMIGKWFE
jgi:hypothetical protein